MTEEERIGTPELPKRAQRGMRTFAIERQHDESGVSGTGIVLEGVVFSSGQTIVHWLTPPPRGSVNVFDGFWQFWAIHVESHPSNRSIIRFHEGSEFRFEDVHGVSAAEILERVQPQIC